MAETAVAVKVDTPPAVTSDGAVILSIIDRMASNPDMPVEKIERMLDMHDRMQKEAARRAFHASLAIMQASLPAIEKGGTGHNGKKYDRLEDIISGIKGPLATHGFALTFRSNMEGPKIIVTGVLSHRDGHEEKTEFSAAPDKSGSKNDIQASGSAITYGKRYVAGMLLGFASSEETDDDGKAAGIGETISEDEEMALREYAESVGTNIPAFCQYFKVAKLADLPKSELARANAALKKKASK